MIKRTLPAIFLLHIVLTNVCFAQPYSACWKAETKAPLVALTFDDGPKPEYSLPILDILDKYCVKGTFFVVGKMVKLNQDIVYRMASSGHDVGNHTFSHTRLDMMDKSQIDNELRLTNQIVEKITGIKPIFFRPPGGRFNQLVLQEAHFHGLKTINWSLNAVDYTPHIDVPIVIIENKWENIVEKVVSNAKPGDIILFHNGGEDTEKALPSIIEKLRQKGFRFVTVSELLGIETVYNKKQFVKLD